MIISADTSIRHVWLLFSFFSQAFYSSFDLIKNVLDKYVFVRMDVCVYVYVYTYLLLLLDI